MFALLVLACGLPLNAEMLLVSFGESPDQLFGTSLLASVSDPAALKTDSAAPADAIEAGATLAPISYEPATFDLLAGRRDDRPEGGSAGVRRFLLLTLVFGAALRYLTSPTFYSWATRAFGPLDEY